MLSELSGAYLKVSLSTAAVIAVLLPLLPLLRRRYAAKWRYAIWVLLAIRLLVPFSIPLPEQPVQIPVPANMVAPVQEGQVWEEDPLADDRTVQYIPSQQSGGVKPSPLIPMVWLAGAAGFLLLQLLLYAQYRRLLRRSNPEPASGATTLRLRRLAQGTGGGRLPEVLVSSAVHAPVLCGFLRTRLYLPHERYTDAEMELILRHELVHYRRRDLWCKVLLLAVECLHWFNPLVYILADQAGKELEFSCDDQVTRNMDRQGRAVYGNTILSALPRARGAAAPLFTTGFSGSKATLKRRLLNLFDSHTKRWGMPALVAVLTVAVALSGTIAYTPALAAGAEGKTVAVAVKQVTPERPELVGRFDIDGSNLVVKLESDSGRGIGIGISKYPNLTYPMTEPWVKYVSSAKSAVRASFVDLEGTYYVYAVSEEEVLGNITGHVQVTKAVSGLDGIERQFQRFAPYGLVYDADQDTATYGGERVTLFVVRRENGAFDLCWYDRSHSGGSLYLEGRQSGAGEAAGIQPLDATEARGMLAELYGAYEPSGQGVGIEPVHYVLNGTQLGPDGFTATDMTQATAPKDVREWMAACDASGSGAYLWQRQAPDGYDTLLYYNLGGRYPWIVDHQGDALTVKLYDNNGKVTGDGYHLMRLKSGIEAGRVTLLLAGKEIPLAAVAE